MWTVDGFCLLEISPEEYKRRRISFALGCVVEIAAIGFLLLPGGPFPNRIQARASRYVLISLPSLAEQEPSVKAPPRRMVAPRKIEPPKPLTASLVPPPRVDAAKIEKPEIQAQIPVPNVSEQPPPMTAAVAVPSPPVPQPPPAVHTGLFGEVARYSGSEKAPLQQVQTGGFGGPHAEGAKIPLRRVQTGGFGDPQGLPGHALGGNPGNVPKLGAFDLPTGPGRGNGTGGAQGMARIVANAGFGGNGVGIGGGSRTPRTVANAGFGGGGVGNELSRGPAGAASAPVKTGVFAVAPKPAPAKPLRAAAPAPELQPVEIISKPLPQYTEEARRLRVQGEVVLSVVFQASGALKVVGVVKSLGHGLDQMAEQAASQIRFKPAQQAGKPTDFEATLRIEFRLA